MLKTETNTKTMEKRVLVAFRKYVRVMRPSLSIGMCEVFFEHGQWWAQYKTSGAQWSICDAEGTQGVFDGFCFEQVSRGDDE